MVRVIVFALIALGWWLAAPDKFTAAARTASGTGMKAAGAGARVHWNAGRDGRKLGRTDRRDRWHKRGGWWRKLLGLERGAVVTGKAVKGAGKLAAAAVRPVPGAIRDGWRAGQERHGARTSGRPVPVALDPPWWRTPEPSERVHEQPATGAVCSRCGRRASGDQVLGYYYVTGDVRLCDSCVQWLDRRYPEGWPDDPAEVTEFGQGKRWPSTTISPQIDPGTGQPVPTPVPDETGQDSPQDSGTASQDSPERVAETGQDSQAEQDREPLDVNPNPPQRTPYNPGYTKDGLTIDDEDEIRARHPVLAQIQPEPLTEAQRRFWTLRDRGYPGPINQDGFPVPEPGALGGFIENPVPYLTREPIDPPAGTDPDGTTTPSTDNPGGTVSPTPFGAELDDLTSVQDFAVKVADMAEESDFAQLVEFCKHASDETRDFGADMAGNVAEFEEIAAKIGDLLSELVDAAQHVRDRSAELIGG